MSLNCKILLFCCLWTACAVFPCASEPAAGNMPAAVTEAINLREPDKILESLSASVQKLSAGQEKKDVLVFRGSLEEQLGRYTDAAASYYEAAFTGAKGRDDSLILDAALCLLSAGDDKKAEEYLKPVLLTSFDDAILARARLYSSWVQLCRGEKSDVLYEYLGLSAMESVKPGILLTLWWTENDESAANMLKKEYPGTPEAAIVRGEAAPLPGAFWYFVSRAAASMMPAGNVSIQEASGSSVSAVTGRESSSSPVSAEPALSSNDRVLWQQLGFFRSEENAESLMKKLKDKGFKPEILRQPRSSGTVYLAVVVKENHEGTIGRELKNAGFECFPLFE